MISAFISISGTDRHDFLQGQLTQDIGRLEDAGSLPAGWCNAKGRVIVTTRLLYFDDRIVMAVPSPALDATIRRLTMYRLRADVSIDVEPALRGAAFATEGSEPGETTRREGASLIVRYSPSFVEAYGTPDDLEAVGFDMADALEPEIWARGRIAAGRASIGPEAAERFTPHMLNLDRTGAISFSKGCYTGQEVVARTEHLGKVKRRLNRYALAGATADTGMMLTLGGESIGEVVNASETEVLAVVPVDKHRETLEINGGTAVPQPLPYSIE